MKLSELKAQLKPSTQNQNTLEGWTEVEGKKIYVHKHWSYEGGYPVWNNEALEGQIIGEFKEVGNPFFWKLDENGSKLYDVEIKFIPHN